MISILKWKGSWSMIATIASIVGLVSLVLASIVHLFFFPLVPSFEYFSQAQNSCVPVNGSSEAIPDHPRVKLEPPINLKNQFPADLHKAVVFRAAPWKAEIGRWLAGCGSITNEVNIVELIGGSGCKNDCSGQGVCNRELGQCRCFHGYSDIVASESPPCVTESKVYEHLMLKREPRQSPHCNIQTDRIWKPGYESVRNLCQFCKP